MFIQNTYLQEQEKAYDTNPYKKRDAPKGKVVEDIRPQAPSEEVPGPPAQDHLKESNIPCRGVIWMTAGGPIRQDSHKAQKANFGKWKEDPLRKSWM
ncbi:UNVERIFIED_CONTAM: hypothetical protein Slati_2642800 [Sesamum latifolium]|uniref:Uncharacterized protein n=1 Tax=Sesamum latifolium TaxID=2727402 RepID=A0AAW2VW13_9LAMI